MNKNPWKTISGIEVYKNPWIVVEEHEVINPSGNSGIYGVVKFVHYAIAIVPIDSQLNTWLIGQWRYPLNAYSWEVPEGGGKKSLTPLESAQRELQEEAGLQAEKWTLIQKLHLSNSATDEEAFVFIAEDITVGEASPDETEELQVLHLPFEKAYSMVLDGEITDALSVASILRTRIYLQQKGLLK